MKPLGSALTTAVAVTVVGAITGFVIAGLDWLVIEQFLNRLRRQSTLVIASAPLIGLVATAIVLRWSVVGASAAVSDDLMRALNGTAEIDHTAAPGRFVAIVTSVGSGLAMGLEAPAAYLGAAVGSIATRAHRFHLDPDLMLTAGAAAGAGALFQQPVMGALFAVEIGYRAGLDLRRLPVALIGALAGFVAFRNSLEVPSMFRVGALDINSRFLVAAVIAGLAGGAAARVFGALVLASRELRASLIFPVRVVVAGLVLGGLYGASSLVDGEGLTLGPGVASVGWANVATRGSAAVAFILLLRLIAAPVSVLGGGAGGLFLPLMTAGALITRVIASPIVADQQTAAIVTLGAAGALAAGYRMRATALAFAITVLGDVAGVIPALLAVAAAVVVSRGVLITTAQVQQPNLVAVRTPRRRQRRAESESESDDDRDVELDDWA